MKNFPNRLFDLKGRVIVLTGSAGVLGTEYANTLSAAGANCILVDINDGANKKLEKTLARKYSTRPMAYSADISDAREIKKLSGAVLKKYKRVDGLVNNAVLNHTVLQTKSGTPKFENFPLEYWEQSILSNQTSVFICCREFGAIMAKRKKGVIVNISSTYGLVGPDQRIYGKSKINAPVSYAATKGSIINMTRYLAAYWHKQNVRVNTLSPGGVENRKYQSKEFIRKYSEKTMLGRMAKKSEYNGALLFLVSDASSYMTGSNLIVDGGWTAW